MAARLTAACSLFVSTRRQNTVVGVVWCVACMWVDVRGSSSASSGQGTVWGPPSPLETVGTPRTPPELPGSLGLQARISRVRISERTSPTFLSNRLPVLLHKRSGAQARRYFATGTGPVLGALHSNLSKLSPTSFSSFERGTRPSNSLPPSTSTPLCLLTTAPATTPCLFPTTSPPWAMCHPVSVSPSHAHEKLYLRSRLLEMSGPPPSPRLLLPASIPTATRAGLLLVLVLERAPAPAPGLPG